MRCYATPRTRAAELASYAIGVLDGRASAQDSALSARLVETSTAAQRFRLGRVWLARALGLEALCTRTRAAQRDILQACLSFAGLAQAPAEIEELGKRLGKQLARAQRKQLTRALAALDHPDVQIEAYLDVLEGTLSRAGMLLADDVRVAFEQGRTPASDELDAAVASPRDLDRLRFWLSPRMLELRRELGWGP